ncbi:hypothetical protein RZE82_06430 [Mollicutes bacterium LVI A0039]|nr:hypothetical protein RZE82_06430 [Mollicutes bacterium LVI A0039]
MNINKDTVIKINFSQINEYEANLTKIKLVLEKCKHDLELEYRTLDKQVEYRNSGSYGAYNSLPTGGPIYERDRVLVYKSQLEEILVMINSMIYAIQMYREYYMQYGAYPNDELIYNAEKMEKILDDFKYIICTEKWQDKISSDEFTFIMWEKSIEFGIDSLENDKERALKYNKRLNEQLKEEMASMTNVVKEKMNLLTDNSSIYIKNIRPLVDGVTIRSILQEFNISSIDYLELYHNTNVKNIAGKIENNQELLIGKFSDSNGELSIQGILENLQRGVSLTSKELNGLKEFVSRYINFYELDLTTYIIQTVTTEGVVIKLTDAGHEILYIKIEETLQIMYSQKVSGIYKVGDPEYIDVKNKGVLSEVGRYLEIGGFIIDGSLFVEGITRGDYSDAGGALGGLTISLIGYGVMNEWNPSGWIATVAGIIIGALSIGGSKVGERIGNSIESNSDWFGDGNGQ